ncbi:MAG: hypothetical protein HZA16_15120 [Nitrospirae bacterium]|nr:hypothetical protein [Nitrospirota bacterium]
MKHKFVATYRKHLFLLVFLMSFCLFLVQPVLADPLVVRVQPSGEAFSNAYVISGEARTYFGNVEGGTPPYSARWELSNGTDTGFAGVGDPRYIPIDGQAFGSAGDHWARLTVTDADGASSSATIGLKVIAAADDTMNRRKNSAIDRGLRYLYQSEILTASGSYWPGSGEPVASTGMALIALENHGHNLQSPDSDIYKKSAQQGVQYLLNNAYNVPLADQVCIGNPEANDGDADNDGIGVIFTPLGNNGQYWDEMYIDPIAMLALVNSCDEAFARTLTADTTSGDVNGMTLWDIIVDAKDFLAYSQNDNQSSSGSGYFSCEGMDSSMWGNISGLTLNGVGADMWVDSSWYYDYSDDWNSYAQVYLTGPVVSDFYAFKYNPEELPCPGDFEVDWGDGSPVETFHTEVDCTQWPWIDVYGALHTYPGAGDYTISVSYEGTFFAAMTVTATEASSFTCPGAFELDWGDGTSTSIEGWDDCPDYTWTDGLSHSYAEGGTYTVSAYHDGVFICSSDVTVAGTSGACENVPGNGWRYERNYPDSDNSVTQWPVLALQEARDRWGINLNPNVNTELDHWLLYSQNANGGFGYTGGEDYNWLNFPKTGAGLIMLKYLGQTPAEPRVSNALSFLDLNWDWENLGHMYGMYGFYKGMKLLGLADLDGRAWEDIYTEYLVANQWASNAWGDNGYWFDQNFSTYTALAILAPAVAGLPPVADAGGPYPDVNAGQTVQLDGSGSYHQDSARSIVKYEWDFNSSNGLWWDTKPAPDAGEGAVGMAADASYPDAGSDQTYTVTLRVTDDGAPVQTDTDTAAVNVTSGEVAPVALTNGPWTGLPNDVITFDGSASHDPNSCTTAGDPSCLGDSIVLYEWDLDGDGNFNEPGDDGTPVTPGDYSVVTKSFPEPISLSAVLRVTDEYGKQGVSAAAYNIISIAIVYGQEYSTCFKVKIDRFNERHGISVIFQNLGNGDAENLVMTLMQTPTNLSILKSVVNIGSLGAGDSETSDCDPVAKTAEVELKFDRRVVPTGSWLWKAEFDFNGKHYVVNNIPPLAP